ncbi:hypothetical protein GV790_30415, partial [Nocardia cyriacigeorgica]|nr:hypothetical protein [Nocardia cyriacigeorgica]
HHEANAAVAAAALGLRHHVIRLGGTDVIELSRDVMGRLGTQRNGNGCHVDRVDPTAEQHGRDTAEPFEHSGDARSG